MAYDQQLTQRIREILTGTPGLVEKKMFGGVGFLIQGNMACGVHKDDLIVRVGPAAHPAALSQPHTRPFDLTGKSMSGWVQVAQAGLTSAAELEAWVRHGLDFALALPPK